MCSNREYINAWVWLCSNKILLTKTSSRQNLAQGPQVIHPCSNVSEPLPEPHIQPAGQGRVRRITWGRLQQTWLGSDGIIHAHNLLATTQSQGHIQQQMGNAGYMPRGERKGILVNVSCLCQTHFTCILSLPLCPLPAPAKGSPSAVWGGIPFSLLLLQDISWYLKSPAASKF